MAEARVRYRAPKGRWPLYLGMSLSPAASGGVSATIASVSADGDVRTRGDGGVFLVAPDGAATHEVVCDRALCEGTITATAQLIPRPWQEAGVASLELDGGSMPTGESLLRVSAEFVGGIDEDPSWACDRKDSSTDSSEPPEELWLELRLAPLELAPSN